MCLRRAAGSEAEGQAAGLWPGPIVSVYACVYCVFVCVSMLLPGWLDPLRKNICYKPVPRKI